MLKFMYKNDICIWFAGVRTQRNIKSDYAYTSSFFCITCIVQDTEHNKVIKLLRAMLKVSNIYF